MIPITFVCQESGRRIKKFAEHNSVVNSVCPARGNLTLVSGSDDGTAKLWDMVC